MFERMFVDHPTSVGETYFQHFRAASGFAGTLVAADIACLIHAVVPGLFATAASRRVGQLHQRMIAGRVGSAEPRSSSHPFDA